MSWTPPLASFTLHSNHRTDPLSPYAVGPLLSRVHTRHRRPRGAARVRPTNPTSTTATSSRGSTPPARRRSRPSTARRCRAPRPPRLRTRSSTARLLPSRNRGAAAVTLFTIARLHGIRSFDRASLSALLVFLFLSLSHTHTHSLSHTHILSLTLSLISRARSISTRCAGPLPAAAPSQDVPRRRAHVARRRRHHRGAGARRAAARRGALSSSPPLLPIACPCLVRVATRRVAQRGIEGRGLSSVAERVSQSAWRKR